MTVDFIENIPQPDTSGSEQVTMFSEDTEDLMRKFLFNLFDLSISEIIVLKGIMNGNSLTQIAKDVQDFSRHNLIVSRHKIFQQRKAMLEKLGERYAQALLTNGQRRRLKT